MRGVIIHLIETSEKELIDWLNFNFGKQNEYGDWTFPNQTEALLFIGVYQDYEAEFEQNELLHLAEKLGTSPTVALAVDVSGKIDGTNEIKSFVLKVLNAFSGLVSDDYSEHFWSKTEIEDILIINDKKFFDFKSPEIFQELL